MFRELDLVAQVVYSNVIILHIIYYILELQDVAVVIEDQPTSLGLSAEGRYSYLEIIILD